MVTNTFSSTLDNFNLLGEHLWFKLFADTEVFKPQFPDNMDQDTLNHSAIAVFLSIYNHANNWLIKDAV